MSKLIESVDGRSTPTPLSADSATGRSIRASTPADVPQIMELMRRAGLKAKTEAGDFHWKYWRIRPDWTGPRSYVMTSGQDILAHAGIIPGHCVWRTRRRLSVIHMIEWAARSDAPGAGVVLMRYIARLADVMLAIGGSMQTRRILPRLGFREVGSATEYAKRLHPIRSVGTRASPAWKVVPHFARSVAWTAATRARGARWQSERVDESDLTVLEPWLSRASTEEVVLERNEALVRHALQCPIARVELYSAKRSGRTRGYFMLAFVPGESRLIDFWVDSDDSADWRGIIWCAVERASSNSSAYGLATLSSSPKVSDALRQCGFQFVQDLPVYILGAESMIPGGVGVRVQMLDYNGAYLWYPSAVGERATVVSP